MPDHVVAFARHGFQPRTIEHLDAAALVTYHSGTLQFAGSLRNTFATNPQHAGDQFLGHPEVVGR